MKLLDHHHSEFILSTDLVPLRPPLFPDARTLFRADSHQLPPLITNLHLVPQLRLREGERGAYRAY